MVFVGRDQFFLTLKNLDKRDPLTLEKLKNSNFGHHLKKSLICGRLLENVIN
jgi:hypothetical protein